MVYAPIWIYKVKYVILSDFIRLLFHTFLVVYRAHVRAFDCLLIYSYVLMLTTRRFVVGLCASVLRVPTNKFHSTIQLDKFVTCFWQNNETRKNGLNIMGQTEHAHSLYAHIQCHIKKRKRRSLPCMYTHQQLLLRMNVYMYMDATYTWRDTHWFQ